MQYNQIKEAKLAIEPPKGFSCYFIRDTCVDWCCRKYREPIAAMLLQNGFRPVVYAAGSTIKGNEGDLHVCNAAGLHGHVRCEVQMFEKGHWRVIHYEDGKQIPHSCWNTLVSSSDHVFDEDNSLMMEAIQRGWERIAPPTIKEK